MAIADQSDILTAYLVIHRKSLDDDPHVPNWIKTLLRWVYQRYGWAATGHDGKSYTKMELVGVYDTATEARWAAMVPGGSYHELPLNCSLPEETCQFRIQDFPMSKASPEYRNRKLPFVAVPRVVVEKFDAGMVRLERKVEQTLDCAEGKCDTRVM